MLITAWTQVGTGCLSRYKRGGASYPWQTTSSVVGRGKRNLMVAEAVRVAAVNIRSPNDNTRRFGVSKRRRIRVTQLKL